MKKKKQNNECCKTPKVKTQRNSKLKKSLNSRLNRIEGQVRGVKGLIEKDVYCDDILNQISAINAALASVSRLVLEEHLKTCVVDKIRDGNDEVIEELLKTLKKML